MIFDVPKTTEELFTALKQKTDLMKPADREMFTLDLMKFVIDWQFALIAMHNEERAARKRPL